MSYKDRKREPSLERSSVRASGDLIVIRTPEGQKIAVTLERAAEWLSGDFRRRLRLAVEESVAPYTHIVPTPATE
jgi:hypothetical protein